MELRHAGDSKPGGVLDGSEMPSRVHYWIKVASALPDDPVTHRAVLTYISDMTLLGATLLLHGKTPSSRDVQAASLDHTVWFHRPFRADEWLLYDQTSPSADFGRALAQGRIFDTSGRMVAAVVQEGLMRFERDTSKQHVDPFGVK